MKILQLARGSPILFAMAAAGTLQAQGNFTACFTSVAPPSATLVNHGDTWRSHKGTNAPQTGWQTVGDAALDGTWASSSGGFGYGDAGIIGEAAALGDMQSRYTTFYLRRTFDMPGPIDPNTHLVLKMDFDDGFVAYLDGAEVARANAPGSPGESVAHTATATALHEASCCNSPVNPTTSFDLGPVGSRFATESHILAIQGLNQAIDSSDFHLIADLATGGTGALLNGALLTVTSTNILTLAGTNTLPDSTRVLVDGADATVDSSSGAWSESLTLTPGFHRLLIQALNSSGAQVYATNKDVVVERTSVSVGGTLGTNTTWSPDLGVIRITNSVLVPTGGSLTIEPGTVCLVSAGASVLITNGTLTAIGEADEAIYFMPADGETVWGGIVASGSSGRILAQYIETAAGHLELFDGATGTFEDSYFHDYTVSSPAIIHTLGSPRHATLELRRCHVARYYEILSQLTTNRFEDCLMEYQAPGGDGIDFDGGQPGSYIRRCTVRHGNSTNIDALDMGEFTTGEASSGVTIDGCLLYDFVDKGVSMGVRVNITVTNCFIHNVDSGIAVKDLSTAAILNCTITSNQFGFRCYNKADSASATGGGYITNALNNVLWDNAQSLALLNGSTLEAGYNDFQGTNGAGVATLSRDPLFLNAGEFDCRLALDSPLLGAGQNGTTPGASFPVGAPMASSHPRIESIAQRGNEMLLRFWADSERTYSVVRSDSMTDGSWTKVADVFPTPLPRLTTIADPLPGGAARFYRVVTPKRP